MREFNTNGNIYKCFLHLSYCLSSSCLGLTPHMHPYTRSCPCCVTGVCPRVGGVWLAETFTWTERTGGNGETAEEGRELVAEGGKQIFVNTSSDVWAFPNACMKHTQAKKEKHTARHPCKNVQSTALPFSSVIHIHCRWLKNANRPTATR